MSAKQLSNPRENYLAKTMNFPCTSYTDDQGHIKRVGFPSREMGIPLMSCFYTLQIWDGVVLDAPIGIFVVPQ